MREIGYARVSKRDQALYTQALDHHLSKLYQYGLSETQIYFDIEQGKSSDREGFQLVMDLVRGRKVDRVVVARLDRFTRSSLHWELAIQEFQKAKVEFKVLDESSIDLETPDGLLFSRIRAAFAQAEVEELSLRSRKGWEYLRKRKVAMNPPFGYCKVNDRHELDHAPFLCLLDGQQELSKAAIARDTIEAFLEGKSLRQAIKKINHKYGLQRFNHGGPKTGFTAGGIFQWSSSGLRQWLTNPVLCGHLSYLRDRQPQVIYNTHPDQRLLSDEESRQIQGIIDHNRDVRGWGFRALRYPLSGLIFCAVCGGSCYSLTAGASGNRRPRDYYYFQCKNYRVSACSQKKSIRMDVAEAAVVAALTQRAEAIANIAITPPERVEPPELQGLRSQLSQLEAIPGRNPAIEMAKHDLVNQIQAFEHQLLQASEIKGTNQELLTWAFSDPSLWENLSDDDKKAIYKGLVERLEIKEGQVVSIKLKV